MCKFYAVRSGRQPGVYENWDEAHDQITQWSNSDWRRFGQYSDALVYLDEWIDTSRHYFLVASLLAQHTGISACGTAVRLIRGPLH